MDAAPKQNQSSFPGTWVNCLNRWSPKPVPAGWNPAVPAKFKPHCLKFRQWGVFIFIKHLLGSAAFQKDIGSVMETGIGEFFVDFREHGHDVLVVFDFSVDG